MTDKQKEALETMRHWIEYEKANKDKINKADELIETQETVLNLIQTQQAEIEKKDKIIDEMAKFIEVFELDEEIVKTYCDGTLENCKHKEDKGTCKSCIKKYFERKVETEDK